MNAQNLIRHSLPAGSREDNGLVGAVQVDKDGHVVVLTLGGCLVQADRLEALQVQRSDGFGHIVMDDEPQAGILIL